MKENLIILGAGQYSYVVAEIAATMGCFGEIDFLDDNSEKAIGRIDELGKLKGKYSYGAVAIGNPSLRAELMQRLEESGYEVAKLVHPMAFVSPTAKIGKGAVIEPMAVVQANSVIGEGSIVSSGAVIRHNGTVGSFCHCDCGSVVMSGAVVGDKTKIPCGEIYKTLN